MLQQLEQNCWKPKAYVYGFITEVEAKFSINNLELLAVVWDIEHFKNYVNGVEFEVVSDHKALKSVLSAIKANTTFSKRLTRWVGRLLPFEFSAANTPGRTLGMTDYLSRPPSLLKGSIFKFEQLFIDWFTINAFNEFKNALSGTIVSKCERPIKCARGACSQSEAENSVLRVVNESFSGGRKEYTHGLHNYSKLNKHSLQMHAKRQRITN